MKRQILILLLIVLTAAASAAPVYNMPAIRIQPNGDTLLCWVSGDEFFHRLHDAEGYTIVQDVQTGQYVYATLEKGVLVPTAYVPGRVNPAQMGLRPHLMPSKEELSRLHHLWDIPEEYRLPEPKTSGINHGTLNNVVVFIRFHGKGHFLVGCELDVGIGQRQPGGEGVVLYRAVFDIQLRERRSVHGDGHLRNGLRI